MSTWDSRYRDRVQLLVDILPLLAREPRFALKGGTAINLFEQDLPRLSVDIDLTCCQSNTGGCVHRFKHVINQALNS